MSESIDPEVLTAIEFLGAVSEKGHTEGTLRKYLRNRRNLTEDQIDLAFEIFDCRRKRQAERPEVTIPKCTTLVSPKYSFLLPNKRVQGEILISSFLRTEKNYCNVIKCLIEEYYTCLCEMADKKKITMSRTELESIFQRLLYLGKFHQSFFNGISHREANFGKLFVWNFATFRDYYIEYTKDCNSTTKKMREYIHDKKLSKALDQIRVASRMPNDDMMDLLLLPMDRIMDYKDFIDSLCEYVDKKQESYYEFLEKASRRIGRIVKWIRLHKHSIINTNEMNKVQQFLRKQCNIIASNRRIVRRGMMIRRTTTWPARNKRYIFFLFNDVFLWTTRKGELQNLVILRDCEVQDSESKTNRARKFQVVVRREDSNYFKLLKLECNSPRQRNEWFDLLKKEISIAKKDVWNTAGTFVKPHADDFAQWVAKNDEWQHPPENTKLTVETQDSLEYKKNENSDANEDEEWEPLPAHRRYQFSRNFQPHELDGVYPPSDDNMSDTSNGAQEIEQVVSHKTAESYGESVNALFPNRLKILWNSEAASNENPSPRTSESRNGILSSVKYPNGPGKIIRRYSTSSDGSTLPFQHSNVSCSSTSNFTDTQRHAQFIKQLKRESSVTMSLSDFI